MRPAELKEWRTKLGLTQEEAGRRLGKSRVTIQNWENGTTPISPSVKAHCQHLEEEQRRRPEYGPVVLFHQNHRTGLQFEEYATNELAVRRAVELRSQPDVGSIFIMDARKPDERIWNDGELRREIDRRLVETRGRPEPGLAERLMEIGRHCASLPVLDDRTDDEILGYDEFGLPH